MKNINFIIISCILLLTTNNILASAKDDKTFCSSYDWGKVDNLISPYLDEFMHTIFVQQGPSANYNTSMAADEALGSSYQYPKEVIDILIRIRELNCE